jgi:replicative DNA helicase
VNYEAQAEKALIGSVLIDSTILDQLGFRLEPRDFCTKENQLIWTAIDYLYKNDKPIDIVTVTEMLNKYNRIEDIGGFESLNNMIQETINAHNFKYYADIVYTHTFRMRTFHAGEEIKKLAEKGDFDSREDLFNQVQCLADGIRDELDIQVHLLKNLRESYERYLTTRKDLIYTGFDQFDKWSGGLDEGWLYVLAARPGVGKTAKMLQMAYSIAKKEVHGPVIIFSLEMKKEELMNRLLSSMTSISLKLFKYGDAFIKQDLLRIQESLGLLDQLPLHIVDKEGMSIEEIRAISRQIKRKYGKMGAIFIDYLGIMSLPENRNMTHSQRIGEVTKRAKWLAKELECPVILLSQMSREGEKASKPSLMHLRDSGSIEQDADVVEILWDNPLDTDEKGKVIQSIIAKGRNIGVKEFRYAFKGSIQRFYDLPS